MGLGVLPGTPDQGQQRGPKAFTSRISPRGTPPTQQIAARMSSGQSTGCRRGADEHLVPLQAPVWRVVGWWGGGTSSRTGCIGSSLRERTRRTQTRTTGDERQNKLLLQRVYSLLM